MAYSSQLDQVIERYFDNTVAIAPSKIQEMNLIYSRLKDQIASYLKSKLPIDIKDFIDIGSSSEGLKVIAPDEFDVFVPLDVSGSYWSTEEDPNDKSFIRIVGRGDHKVQANLVQDGALSAGRTRAVFQGAIQQLMNTHVTYEADYELRPGGSRGPAITMDVSKSTTLDVFQGGIGRRKLFSLDLVPLVVLGNKRLMAKSHPDAVHDPQSKMRAYWMRSFLNQETHHAKNITQDVRKVLMIVKAMRVQHHSQLGMLDSYSYKNAFMHWHYSDQGSIRRMSVSEKLRSYISFLARKIEEGRLEPYPVNEHHCNLLKKYEKISLENLKNYLKRLVSSDDFLINHLR